MIWYPDRLLRSGPLCAVATLVLPMALAFLVNAQRTHDDVLGVMLVAAGIIFIGSVAGSAVTAMLGIALLGMGALLAEPPVPVVIVVGAGLFVTMVLHDMAGVLHRGPWVSRRVWVNTVRTTAAVVAAGAVGFAIAYGIGGLATWQNVVVPFAVVAIGFAAKLAADSHRTTAKSRPG